MHVKTKDTVIVISGKVNRKYFEEQFYGMTEEKQKGAS